MAKPDEVDLQGQITVPLDGQEYLLRPSYEAIQNIERQLRPLYDLVTASGATSLSVEEMGIIVAELMRAQGKACPDDPLAGDYKGAKPERCAQLIYEAGAPRVCARLFALLLGAMAGGYDSAGEVKAPASKTD